MYIRSAQSVDSCASLLGPACCHLSRQSSDSNAPRLHITADSALAQPWATVQRYILLRTVQSAVRLLTETHCGPQAQQKRERNDGKGKAEAKSQLKTNEAAMNKQCTICKQSFFATTNKKVRRSEQVFSFPKSPLT